MVTTKDKLEFVFAMAKHSHATMWDLQRLMRYGSTHHRLMEEYCNDGQSPLRERKLIRTEKAIQKIVDSFGASVKLSGDPRGATVKIIVPDGYTNDWGKEGICVPTS
jgi:hypothetical protein